MDAPLRGYGNSKLGANVCVLVFSPILRRQRAFQNCHMVVLCCNRAAVACVAYGDSRASDVEVIEW